MRRARHKVRGISNLSSRYAKVLMFYLQKWITPRCIQKYYILYFTFTSPRNRFYVAVYESDRNRMFNVCYIYIYILDFGYKLQWYNLFIFIYLFFLTSRCITLVAEYAERTPFPLSQFFSPRKGVGVELPLINLQWP